MYQRRRWKGNKTKGEYCTVIERLGSCCAPPDSRDEVILGSEGVETFSTESGTKWINEIACGW